MRLRMGRFCHGRCAVACVRPIVGKVQRTIGTEFGNQLEVACPDHLEGVVVSKVSIQDDIHERNQPGNPRMQRLDHGLDVREFRRQRDRRFGLGGAAFGATRFAFGGLGGGGRHGRFGSRRRLLFGRAQHLLNEERKRATLGRADER